MTGEILTKQDHSKGLAFICKGKEKHEPVTELENLWKRN